jgi:hypothetical protein
MHGVSMRNGSCGVCTTGTTSSSVVAYGAQSLSGVSLEYVGGNTVMNFTRPLKPSSSSSGMVRAGVKD